jgi:hypothetical protein
MKIENKNDLLEFIAQKTGKPKEVIRFVIRNYENTLRKALSSPLETGTKITIGYIFAFDFRKEKAQYDVSTSGYSEEKGDELIQILKEYYNEGQTYYEDLDG